MIFSESNELKEKMSEDQVRIPIDFTLDNRKNSDGPIVFSLSIQIDTVIVHVTREYSIVLIQLMPRKGKLGYLAYQIYYLSQLMRLWYCSSSVAPFFKRACAALQWG